MTESIRKTSLFDTEAGPVCSIRLTNNTGDYIDLTNYGARLLDIFVHVPGGGMENIAPPCPEPTPDNLQSRQGNCLLGGTLGAALSHTVWDIVDTDQTSIMLAAETEDRIKVGLHITWVNLNRLILDYFVTPAESREIRLQSSLELCSRPFELSCFCPEVNGVPAADTAYADMAFQPMKNEAEADVFADKNDAIKPLFELKDTASSLRVSLYSTQHRAKAWADADRVCLATFDPEAVSLPAGASLTERVICGIDHITANLASDENDPESPFLGFF